MLQYRKRYELLQPKAHENIVTLSSPRYNTASGMSCCNCWVRRAKQLASCLLQYRKRYELLQPSPCQFPTSANTPRYNTASGMSCCNDYISVKGVGFYYTLQYRKRYELLQHWCSQRHNKNVPKTLQYRKRYELLQLDICDSEFAYLVTIPQAVWAVATSWKKQFSFYVMVMLQYRKRYELLQPSKQIQ